MSYWVLIKSTLGAFFPIFGDGNTVAAIVAASVGIWLFHFMILRGIQQAAFVNTSSRSQRSIPIIAFIVILAIAFQADLFSANFWGGRGMPETSLFEQVRSTMLVTVFVFLGIEGASVYSRYARTRADVGRATLIGFVSVTTLMVLVTLLPYAVLERAEIAGMRQPSMGAVLEAVVGPWGAMFVAVGLLISVLGAYLAWSLICAEVLSAAARTRDMPLVFARENRHKVPVVALWTTNIVVQLFVISTYWSRDAFALMLSLTSAMALIPFLLVAAYGYLLARGGEAYLIRPEERKRDLFRVRWPRSIRCSWSTRGARIRPPVGTALCTWHRSLRVGAPGAGSPGLQRHRMVGLRGRAARLPARAAWPCERLDHRMSAKGESSVMTQGSSRPLPQQHAGFGVHSEVGHLRKVMVCAPGRAHRRLTPTNCDELLFDDVLWVDIAKRDHFDFITKMRDRGIEVVEMHNLLAETLAVPEAKKWILDNQVVPNQVGLGLVDEIRAYLEGLSHRDLAETLIGGLSTDEFPDAHGGEMLKLVREAAGVTEYLLPPLPNTLYTRDTTCWIYGGVTLNPLYWPARHEETILTTAIYKFHPDFAGKVNVWWGDPQEDHGLATLEGGDVMPIGKGNVLIGMSERTSRQAISQLAARRCSNRARPNA